MLPAQTHGAIVPEMIYVGLVVSFRDPILNQRRYDAVLNEMLQLLQTHKDDVNIELIADRFIVITS